MRNQPLITDLEFADGNYLLDVCSTIDLDLIDIARETTPNTYIFTDLSADKNIYHGEDIIQCLTKVIEHPAIEDYIESYIGISPEEQFDKWHAKIVKEETQKTTLTLTNNQRKWLDKNYVIDIEMTQVYQTGTLNIANWQPGANPLGYYDAFRVDDTDYSDTVPTFSIRPVETIDYLKTNLTFSQLEAFIEELIEKEYVDELTQSFKAVIELPELISKDLTLSVQDLDSATYATIATYDDHECLLDALSGAIIALNGEEVQINFYRSKNRYTLINLNSNLSEGQQEIEYPISPFIFKNYIVISDVIYDNRFDKQ